MQTLRDRGYAVIGPNGQNRPGRFGTGWYFHPDRPKLRDELAYLTQVADDAAARFDVNRDTILLVGFSVGVSMTSYLACQSPTAFAAYAPVADAFWRRHPTDCAGPVRLLHTHGSLDTTVPLEGQRGDQAGGLWHSELLWRAETGCYMMRPDKFNTIGDFWVRTWTDCTDGSALSFALHPGAHEIPRGRSDLALDWLESLPR